MPSLLPLADPASTPPPPADEGLRAWLRWGLGPLGEGGGGWVDPATGTVAVVRRRRAYGVSLTVLGDPGAVPDVAAALLPRVRPVHVTVRRGPAADAVRAALPVAEPAEWDWMWTRDAPPAVPAEDAVADLGPADHAAVADLLAAESPRHSAEPGEPQVRRWVGVRAGDGTLLACGADYEAVPGVPLLASVAVASAARGRGLGAAVTAALTRGGLGRSPVVTVDLYADNPSAARLYRRLGFRPAMEFASFRLGPG